MLDLCAHEKCSFEDSTIELVVIERVRVTKAMCENREEMIADVHLVSLQLLLHSMDLWLASLKRIDDEIDYGPEK